MGAHPHPYFIIGYNDHTLTDERWKELLQLNNEQYEEFLGSDFSEWDEEVSKFVHDNFETHSICGLELGYFIPGEEDSDVRYHFGFGKVLDWNDEGNQIQLHPADLDRIHRILMDKFELTPSIYVGTFWY